jgi:amino acid transporter
MLGIGLLILAILTLINLRGVRESGMLFTAPTYLFVFCLLTVLLLGTIKTLLYGGHPRPIVSPPHFSTSMAGAVTAWLLIRAFASGCTALTGVEAVSNGVTAFRNPNTQTARRTLAVIVALLALFLIGIAYLTRIYGIVATEPGSAKYQSLLSMIAAAVVGKGVFYYVTIASILVLLSLSANTAFADFPRLCRAIAEDGYLPHFFAIRGRRLVYTEGILALAILSSMILIAFGGVTDRLIPLFAIGAFLAFTLSQAGMVMHWRRTGGRHSKLYMTINGAGAIATGCTVIIVLIAKFVEGAWITVLLVPLLIFLMHKVHHYYRRVEVYARARGFRLNPLSPPLAILPVSHWDQASEDALQFACSLTPDVQVLHIECSSEHGEETSEGWQQELDRAARATGVKPPEIVALPSPFRFITTPILNYVLEAEKQFPNRKIAVVVPELVTRRWYQYLLHNHRSTVLKAMLLLQGNRRIIVINVPWYLEP